MSEHIDKDTIEELLVLARVFSKKSNTWIPAIIDQQSHDIDPLWVSAVIYMILDRYISCVPDNLQIEFQEMTMKFFNEMLESGSEFVYRIED